VVFAFLDLPSQYHDIYTVGRSVRCRSGSHVVLSTGPDSGENLFLRQQLAQYQERQVKPRRANDATRISLVWLSQFFDWRKVLVIVQPATLIRWHRQGFRWFWRWRSKPGSAPHVAGTGYTPARTDVTRATTGSSPPAASWATRRGTTDSGGSAPRLSNGKGGVIEIVPTKNRLHREDIR
jgi:hypothetical protein